ncbi:MAG: methyltransferase family protein, partial [Mycobacterium sp.]
GEMWWRPHGAAFLAMTTLYAASWLLLGKAMFDASLALQTGSLGWVALLRNKNPIYPKMPVRGLFRLSRQPIYVSFALTLWTVPMWTPDQLVVAVTFTGYCLVGPLFKEARYRRIYGSGFDAYARRVPYWLPWPRKV